MSATAEHLRAIEEAFLKILKARHPDLDWEPVDSDNPATPLDPDPVLDRRPSAA